MPGFLGLYSVAVAMNEELNMPTPEQLRRKIAEVLGVTSEKGDWYCPQCDVLLSGESVTYGETHDAPLCGAKVIWKSGIKDWPTNRDDSYELIKDIDFAPFDYAVMSAYDESLLYLETKGWRWVECDAVDCMGSGVVAVTIDDEDGNPIHGADQCEYCNGKGGEWVKA